MAVLLSTDFTGLANGAAWPAPWARIGSAQGTTTLDVQATAGRCYVGGMGNYSDSMSWGPTTLSVPADFELTMKLRWSADSFPHVQFRGQGGSVPPAAYYDLLFDWDSLRIIREAANGTYTDLGKQARSWSATTWYRVRLRVEGTKLSARVWIDGQAEPSTWDLTATDATYASGSMLFQFKGGQAKTGFTVTYDDIVVSDLGSTPAPTPVTISGSQAPKATDANGTSNDVVTLTKVTGVTWTVDGVDHTSASFTGSTKVVPYTKGVNTTVTAKAESGYSLSGTTSWVLTFTNYVPPTPTSVPAGSAPVAVDADGTSTDLVRLTAVPGIIWSVEGKDYTTTQDVPYTKGVDLVVTARAASGYTLSGTASWTLTFTNYVPPIGVSVTEGQAPVANDLMGVDSDTITLTKVTGVTWSFDDQVHTSSSFTDAIKVIPYTKGVAVTVTAVAEAGYTLTGITSWVLSFTNELEPDPPEFITYSAFPPENPYVPEFPTRVPSVHYSAWRLNGDGTETLIASSLPLTGVKITPRPLSTAPSFSWMIEPEYMALKDEKGAPILIPWSTAIYGVDEEGVLRAAGILKSLQPQGATLKGTMIGWSDYIDGMPWTGTIVKRYGVDPGEVIQLIWKEVQAQPKGNIGLVVPRVTTAARVGTKVTKTTTQPKPTSTSKTTSTDTAITTTTTQVERKLYTDKNVVTTTTTTKSTNKKTKVTTTTIKRTIKTTTKDLKQTTVTQTLDISGKILTSSTSTTTVTSTPQLIETTVESDEPFVLANYATEDLGQVFDEMLSVGSIDFREEHTLKSDGTVRHELVLGYPRLGRRRTDISFQLQTNVLEVPSMDIDAEDYASEVLVLGAGDGEKMVRASARNSNASRLRRVKVLKFKGIGRAATAQTTAVRYAGLYDASVQDIEQLEVIDHPMAPMLSWESGDEVRLTGDGMWSGNIDMWVRILSTSYDPEQPHTATLEVIRADKAS